MGQHQLPLASPLKRVSDGIVLTVKLTPKASKARLGGVALDANGAAALKAWVTAAPIEGRANEALVELIAKSWRLPKSAIRIVRGASDRTKSLRIEGDPDELENRVREAM